MTLATYEEVIEPEIVLSFAEHVEAVTGHHESFKFHRGKTVEAAVLTGASLAAAKADLPHGKWGDFLNEVDMDHRYARQFMSIGRNQAISNRSNCSDLPTAMRTLYELSCLEPEDIESGIESGAITPDMKIEEAKAFARSEWPVVPEPTDEERIQKFEDTRERLINEGYLPKPRTEEERKADAKEFVESLIGNTKRQAEPATPEEPQRDSMTVALINDLRGPWRRGIKATAKKMTQKERQLLIEAVEATLNELKEI